MNARAELGKQSEVLAIDYFLARGPQSRLVARNYRRRTGELDLVFEELDKKGEWILVFLEVKARVRKSYLVGLENLSWKQLGRIRKTAEHFLARYHGPATQTRFDFLFLCGKEWQYFPSYL